MPLSQLPEYPLILRRPIVQVRAAALEHGVKVEIWRVARGLISLTDGLWREIMIDRTGVGVEVAREICTDFLARQFRPESNC